MKQWKIDSQSEWCENWFLKWLVKSVKKIKRVKKDILTFWLWKSSLAWFFLLAEYLFNIKNVIARSSVAAVKCETATSLSSWWFKDGVYYSWCILILNKIDKQSRKKQSSFCELIKMWIILLFYVSFRTCCLINCKYFLTADKHFFNSLRKMFKYFSAEFSDWPDCEQINMKQSIKITRQTKKRSTGRRNTKKKQMNSQSIVSIWKKK